MTKRVHRHPIRLAVFNGVQTTAKKSGKLWRVGGDYPRPGDSVQIAALHKDVENGGDWWAWYKLRGCFLVFDDFMSDAEIAEQKALAARTPTA